MKKSIKKFLGIKEEGNPYGLKFFINMGSLFFLLLAVISIIPQNNLMERPEGKELKKVN